MPEFPPALLLIFGAALVPILPLAARRIYVIALPLAALAYIFGLPHGEFAQITLLQGFGEMTGLRVDKLSKAFGIIFTLNAMIAFLFAFYVKRSDQHVAALVYIGGALGVVFAGDLISVYIYWELMAVASTFIILARQTERAKGAAFRYLLIHIVGGLILLAGILLTIGAQGSIAFEPFSWDARHLGTWLILVGVLVNAAAPPFSAWLSDAYPEASVTGGLILSAYTTKTSVYVLLRGFTDPGNAAHEAWPILIVVGCVMALYGIIFALLENDMRRILAYSIINQVGFMVCAAGVGTSMAVDGAVAHAFCHIIYKSLLWMSAGAVLYRVGKSKCTELGGLYKTMPLTLIFGTIGALAISALPFTSGFTSKTMIVSDIHHHAELFWAWLVLEIASAGVFLHAGIKFPYFVFFNKDRGHRPKEAPKTMLIAMGILAFFCILLGCWKAPLYSLLPNGGLDSYTGETYQPYKWAKIITQMQLLMFSALVFFLFLKLLKRTPTIVLDTDWFYRKFGKIGYRFADGLFNTLNATVHRVVVKSGLGRLSAFLAKGPQEVVGALGDMFAGESSDKIAERLRTGTFPIGLAALFGMLLFALLYFL